MYPCNLIKDLLPLYHDGICSEESMNIVEKHFLKCNNCKEYYVSIYEAEQLETSTLERNLELKKAASFKSIKQKLFRKQILVTLAIVALLIVFSFSVIGFLKKTTYVIQYEDNISVSFIDGSLIGRLKGNEANYFRVKIVEIEEDEQPVTYLFFYLATTKWENIITSNNVYSDYVLSSLDKGAETIDAVYYYTGDYTNIESMNTDELEQVITTSVLLWKK